MDRSIPLLLIGLVLGFGIGFTVAAGNGITLDGHDHDDPAHHGGAHVAAAHDHAEALELPASDDAPTVALELFRDPGTGWNLHAPVTGFRFSPQNAGGAHVPGEGHAHVYVDGRKIARIYGPWLHIEALPEGAAEVEVALYTNDHRPIRVGGMPVAARVPVPEAP